MGQLATLGEEEPAVRVPAAVQPGLTDDRHIPLGVALVSGGLLLTLLAAAVSGRVMGFDLLLPAGILLTVILSYVEGTNSISETVATLVGSNLASYRTALAWGAFWTATGGVAAAFLATALVKTFTTGLTTGSVHPTEALALAVLAATAVWMVTATRLGLPVASTHALTGGLVAVAILAYGADHVKWARLLEKVVIPVLLSPIAAIIAALLLYFVVSRTLARTSQAAMNGLHWLSSAAASFGMGLNHGPKMAVLGTLLLTASGHSSDGATPFWVFLIVGIAMGLGSFLGGQQVTRTLAEKVTNLDHSEAFSANLVTAVTVGLSSRWGLPVSVAEVGSGAIAGVGLHDGVHRVHWGIVRSMLLAWVVTAPLTGILSVLFYLAFRFLHLGHG